MWNATVIEKEIDARGNLVVTVDFEDGAAKIREAFATSQGQPDGWLEEQVSRKLKSLEAVTATVTPDKGVTLGKLPDPEPEPSGDALRDAYAADMARYQQYLAAVRLGIAIDTVQDFIDLKVRLKDNFLPAYLDLF